MAAFKRGLKRGLDQKRRAILVMLDETIITETPPLYSAYGHIGEQIRVPITGNRTKRILHGAINIRSGDVTLLITEEWVNETHQAFLKMIRSHWRGWDPVLFEDRASQHKSPSSLELAEGLGIVDSLYGQYGERPSQDSIRLQGDPYLRRAYPNLDRIRAATIVREWR